MASALRKSTNKLCRLFRENTSLEYDDVKVKGEREELLMHLDQFMSNIQQNTFDSLIEIIAEELEGQNKLYDYQSKEKVLSREIRDLKSELNQENQ